MADPEAPSSLAGNLLASVASIAVLAVLFTALEGGLRAAGVGAPDASSSRLQYQQLYLPILAPGARPDGTAVWATEDPRLPFQTILAEKPANGLRVVVFGGSATAGLGFSPNATFARHLERMLADAYPDRSVEVLNLGIVALASRQVKLLVSEVTEHYDPDVLVVYSGNNEFLEIHAEKYAAANQSWLGRAGGLVQGTHLLRALRQLIRGRPRPPSLADHDFSRDALRVTQDRIIQDVAVSDDEIQAVVDHYEANLEELARSAAAGETPLLMLAVASNWRWRGRADLPAGWRDEFGAPGEDAAPALLVSIVERLEAAPRDERAELLFRRAVVEEELGDFEAARESYRAAMNADPHLRRALDAMNERVQGVAARNGAGFLDAVAVLGADAPHGIVGFEHFYDYVHFTPRGAVRMAEAVFASLRSLGVLPPPGDFSAAAYRDRELAALEDLSVDPLELASWMGVGDQPGRQIADRDLWKYDLLVAGFDERLAEDGDDLRALVQRGNAAYFRVDGADAAERDYRAALALAPDDPIIRANLARLRAERPLGAVRGR